MAFQTGTANPPTIVQDNSGHNEDITQHVEYRPEEFGAPDGATIVGAPIQQVAVSNGPAEVRHYSYNQNSVSFDVWTAAAGGFPFGHHSGHIVVTTSFQWSYED